MNKKLKDIVINDDTLISCLTKKDFDLVVKVATEQFAEFNFQMNAMWTTYKEETMISVYDNTFGPLTSYTNTEIEPIKNPNIVQVKDIIVTKEENPEYWL